LGHLGRTGIMAGYAGSNGVHTPAVLEDQSSRVPADLPPALQPFGTVPPLVSDIDLAVDGQMLYVSCWGTGELKQYDVSDPAAPREVGSIQLGGIVRRTAHPSAPSERLACGPQILGVAATWLIPPVMSVRRRRWAYLAGARLGAGHRRVVLEHDPGDALAVGRGRHKRICTGTLAGHSVKARAPRRCRRR
jgi:hypothetical protein